MAEELAGEELAGKGRAVDLDVGGATPATQLLKGVGNELLSSPPLAADEYGGIGPCHAFDLPMECVRAVRGRAGYPRGIRSPEGPRVPDRREAAQPSPCRRRGSRVRGRAPPLRGGDHADLRHEAGEIGRAHV